MKFQLCKFYWYFEALNLWVRHEDIRRVEAIGSFLQRRDKKGPYQCRLIWACSTFWQHTTTIVRSWLYWWIVVHNDPQVWDWHLARGTGFYKRTCQNNYPKHAWNLYIFRKYNTWTVTASWFDGLWVADISLLQLDQCTSNPRRHQQRIF